MIHDLEDLKNIVFNKTQLVFLITDPNQQDNPIIYANHGFLALTGYDEEEVLGRNCRFLQGEDTDPEAIERLREAIREKKALSLEIANYKKNGQKFWNLLHIDPIYIEAEDKYYFAGIQKDITEFKYAEETVENYNKEIALLSTPLVPIKDSITILPLIGNIDEKRMQIIVDRTLPELAKTDVEILIVDLSGFTDIDESATVGIYQLGALLKLKGIEMCISGITPKVAMRTKGLDIDLSAFKTYGSVKQALNSITEAQ